MGRTFAVGGLAYPSGHDAPRPWEAVELLAARRAQYAWTPLTGEDRQAMERICRAVEGLPLAIELAAALTRERTLPEIAAGLEEDLDILATPLRDAPARHRSLAAAFEASWGRLSPELQGCLARLAAFDRCFSAGAAQRIAQTDARSLGALCDHSLLAHRAETGRYWLHPAARAALPGFGSAPALPNQ